MSSTRQLTLIPATPDTVYFETVPPIEQWDRTSWRLLLCSLARMGGTLVKANLPAAAQEPIYEAIRSSQNATDREQWKRSSPECIPFPTNAPTYLREIGLSVTAQFSTDTTDVEESFSPTVSEYVALHGAAKASLIFRALVALCTEINPPDSWGVSFDLAVLQVLKVLNKASNIIAMGSYLPDGDLGYFALASGDWLLLSGSQPVEALLRICPAETEPLMFKVLFLNPIRVILNKSATLYVEYKSSGETITCVPVALTEPAEKYALQQLANVADCTTSNLQVYDFLDCLDAEPIDTMFYVYTSEPQTAGMKILQRPMSWAELRRYVLVEWCYKWYSLCEQLS